MPDQEAISTADLQYVLPAEIHNLEQGAGPVVFGVYSDFHLIFLLPFQFFHLPHHAVRIAREDADRSPIIEAVGELSIAAREFDGVDAGARQAVVTACAFAFSNL